MPKQTSATTGSELFIVDNSHPDWQAKRYLHDWCQLARQFDIATGYFEIGALLCLGSEWQKVDKIRILMGDEVSKRTKHAFTEGLTNIRRRLDQSLENEKKQNDFLDGVPAIVEALRSKKIECKVFRKEKFHAKAYITHARLEIIGSTALVGSSNFTYPGLSQNIELNVQITGTPVAVLQDWYEKLWLEAEDVTPEILQTFEHHTRPFTPFEVYFRSLYELFRSHELTAGEWEREHSTLYPILDQYQREGYQGILKIARQFRGAFMCDGVGLGKTFIGLMLIERLIQFERKRVVLIVPKSARLSVWQKNIEKYLPKLGGVFTNLFILNHSDLLRGDEFPEKLARIKELADVIIIDEAHHFRNPGVRDKSRYWQLRDIAEGKTVFFLTATPVNNRLTDFMHMVEIFAGEESTYFAAAPLGIHSLQGHFRKLENALARLLITRRVGGTGAQQDFTDINLAEAEEVLCSDRLFSSLVVQRSRAYVKASQVQNGSSESLFPKKADPQVVQYSMRKTYGELLGSLERAFSKKAPLFSLAIYSPYSFYKGDKSQLDAFVVGRQEQVVGLIRTLFLKRFESSLAAFESSCHVLLQRLLAFVQKNAITPTNVKRLNRWRDIHAQTLGFVQAHQLDLWGEPPAVEDDEAEEDYIGEEFLEAADLLDRDQFDVEAILDETYLDLDQIADFLRRLQTIGAAQDDKLRALTKLLKTDPVLSKYKVIIFTEFMTTARYLKRELEKAGFTHVAEVDSATKRPRDEVIQEFAPYYNGLTSGELAAGKRPETRILIATDVLAEGLNLQDATRLINYDLHWNPVRLMQRIGRVDRRLNPAIEKALLADHPGQKKIRGTVAYWNFLPPDDLETLLGIYEKVTHKTLRISKVFGIEGKKLLTPGDDYDALKDYNQGYEGTTTPVEEMRLELQQLIRDHPDIAAQLPTLPNRIFTGRTHGITPGTQGAFFCYALPAQDKTPAAHGAAITAEAPWTEEAGFTQWYYYDFPSDQIVEEPEKIVAIIRSQPTTERQTAITPSILQEVRAKVEKHVKNTYLRKVQAPLGVEVILKCWMELN